MYVRVAKGSERDEIVRVPEGSGRDMKLECT